MLLLNMEAGSARIVESAIYDDHLFFLPIARMHQVLDCHPSPFYFSKKKCRFKVVNLQLEHCIVLFLLPFVFDWAISNARREDRLLEPTRRPSEGQKLIAETPNARLALCSPFCLHKKSQLDVITTQRRQKNVRLSSLPLQYALSCFPTIEVAFVHTFSVEANRAHVDLHFLDGCASFPS